MKIHVSYYQHVGNSNYTYLSSEYVYVYGCGWKNDKDKKLNIIEKYLRESLEEMGVETEPEKVTRSCDGKEVIVFAEDYKLKGKTL